jgi:hypothetical protein
VVAERREKAQDAAGLGAARAVVIPGDHDHHCVGQRRPEPRELLEGVDDRGVHRANRVEHIAGDDHDVRTQRDDAIHRAAERVRDVRFALVDPGGRQPVVLPEAQMEVSEVYEPHTLM